MIQVPGLTRVASVVCLTQRVHFELQQNKVQLFRRLDLVTPKQPTKELLAKSPDQLKPAIKNISFKPQAGFPRLFEGQHEVDHPAAETVSFEVEDGSSELNVVVDELKRIGASQNEAAGILKAAKAGKGRAARASVAGKRGKPRK